MYQAFVVKNFRCFRETTLKPLERLNLIAGKNNIGKTALLEALWLHHGADVPDLGVRVDAFRGFDGTDPKEFLWDLFHDFQPSSTIELTTEGDWGANPRTLRIHLQRLQITEMILSGHAGIEVADQERSSATERASDDEIVFEYTHESGKKFTSRAWMISELIGPGIRRQAVRSKQEPIPQRPIAIYLAARQRSNPRMDAERYGKLEISGYHEDVVKILREIEPRLGSLTVIESRGAPNFFGDIGLGRLVPLPLMGDGMGRLLSLAIAIATVPKSMVLVDEIENGLHHTVMVKVWKGIAAFARKFDVQVFATTHSEECIRSAHRAFEEDETYDFCLHRLERVNGNIRSVTYDKETLGTALVSGLEMR